MTHTLIDIPIFIIIFLFGIVIGSFLNVCIYRIPKGESIVVTPSHCMSCGYHLKWYDLIPLFSWLFLKGKCRNCGAPISKQYPIVEGVNGLAYVIIYALTDFAWIQGAVYCLLFSALLVLSVIDERTMEIPIGINIFIAVLGVFYTCYDREHLIEHIIGFFAVSLLLEIILLVSKGRAIGGGDVKLMAAAGLLLGWQNIYFAFATGCILGSVLHILRMKFTGAGKTLALGPYLSMGILLAALFGQRFILWYGNLLFAGIG